MQRNNEGENGAGAGGGGSELKFPLSIRRRQIVLNYSTEDESTRSKRSRKSQPGKSISIFNTLNRLPRFTTPSPRHHPRSPGSVPARPDPSISPPDQCQYGNSIQFA